MSLVVAVLATIAGLPMLLSAPAVAGPVDTGWSAGGSATVTTVSDGTASAAAMTYNSDGQTSASWTFTTKSTPASAVGPIKVPYTWQGLHAWFMVTTRLDLIVDGIVVQTLEQHGPTSCCTSPSNGFLYGGVATFNVSGPGHTYGFQLSGSNADYNRFLHGTLTLSTKPYLDATIGTDNRDWPGAKLLSTAGAVDRTLQDPGEARWFKFPAVPGQHVSVALTDPPADYDVALYGDIGAAFDQLSSGNDLSQLAAGSTGGVSDSQVPAYPGQTSTIPTSTPLSNQFAPRIYAPRIYAPRIYAPRIYAPRIYAPRIYAPRIYAPDSYIPGNFSDTSFTDAFSAAQNQTLLAASANAGPGSEAVSASTGNTNGFFYVRVQGHTDQAFNASTPFTLTQTTSGNDSCVGVHDYPADSVAPISSTAKTVVVTDTSKLGLTNPSPDYSQYLASLQSLGSAADVDVVDVAGSTQVQNLWLQVGTHVGCPYAVNLVADAIKTIVDQHRNANNQYVVIAGGDDVIPFFRYPDVSGLGQESQFSPPVLPDTPSGASLNEDQVQSQDAYGSDLTVSIGGVTLPLPDLAVGRLVKTPGEIQGTIANYLALGPGGTLPRPTASLVTGYDFLADAADSVNAELVAALPGTAVTDALITHPNAVPAETPWTGDDLSGALLGRHHDVVYLAGHFSANDTLAADFATTFDADVLDPAYVPDPVNAPDVTNADKLKNTLVLSAGCHSGYNIVNGAATGTTNPFDWTQRMAQQHAVLIGGTGYQYGDSDFLEYSERLYLDVARRLHEAPAAGVAAAPIAIGTALALAKQDYLSGLATVSGIDQKAMLEATLYGLPMTGFDAPRRSALPTDDTTVTSTPVVTGTPGAAYGLQTAELPVTPGNVSHNKTDAANPTLTWLSGPDGVTIQPGVPALPKQIKDVTVAGQILRGVGFRSGDYSDTAGLLPLTGAPAIEGSTPNTTFESDAFFPQRLVTANYFGALGASGRTSLILNPAQYRTDPGSDPALPTNTQRDYSHLGLRLFYSPHVAVPAGQNLRSQAAPPAVGAVRGVMANGVITFAAQVTGDPSAGVQEVWVTWTGSGNDSGHGHWRSVDLVQDPNDSTHWRGSLSLPDGQSLDGMRFLVQAANGAGAVGLDTKNGDGYSVSEGSATDTAAVAVVPGGGPFGVHASVSDAVGPISGRSVLFTVLRAGVKLFDYPATSSSDGTAALALPAGQAMPGGRLRIVATIFDSSSGQPSSSDSRDVVLDTITLVVAPTTLTALAGGQLSGSAPVGATLTDARGMVTDYPVTFSFPTTGPSATFPVTGGGSSTTITVLTDGNGKATVPPATANSEAGGFALSVAAEGAVTSMIPVQTSYTLGAFISPILSNGTATTTTTGTTPIKFSANLANNVRMSDEAAGALVTAGRVQVRWRLKGATSPWLGQTTDLTRYVVAQHFFQADFKASTWKLTKGNTYEVMVRILPSPKPTGTTLLQGIEDVAHRSFYLSVTK